MKGATLVVGRLGTSTTKGPGPPTMLRKRNIASGITRGIEHKANSVPKPLRGQVKCNSLIPRANALLAASPQQLAAIER